MQISTTIRVSRTTHQTVRALADDDGITLDEEIQRLARSERQRRMGVALASTPPTGDDRAWLDMSASEATHARR